MSNTKARVNEAMDASGMSSDLESIRASFNDLRQDIAELLSNAMGLGKSGASAARDGAVDAMDSVKRSLADLKEQGATKVSVVEKAIEDNPVAAALIALGVGYVVARILTRKS